MKRSLILSLCAVVLAAIGMSAAQATVDVALNLRYTDPADPSEGGTWTLVATSDDPNSNGITALVVNLLNMPASGVVDGSIGHDINDANANLLVIGTFGAYTEFVYGQDPNDGLVANVGLVGGPSDQGSDPLNNSAWDNASIIATGAIADLTTRPTFSTDPNRPIAANVDVSGTIVAATIGLTNVRGDSENSLGLESGTGLFAGDLNRDGAVGPSDLGTLGINWDPAGVINGWDDGDFNDDGAVGPADLGTLGINWDPAGSNFTPPAIAAVPEPSAILLLSLAGIGIGVRRRR